MKQLKHRFQKWEIKKYISGNDMEIMLSLQYTHRSAGRDVRFKCNGRPITPERLQQALRKRKEPLIPPTCQCPDLFRPVYTRVSDRFCSHS